VTKEILIQFEVFWVVTPSSVVVRYQRFGGPRSLHLAYMTTLHKARHYWPLFRYTVATPKKNFNVNDYIQY